MKLSAIVVDDDQVISKILSELIESLGLKLLGKAANGQDAVKLNSMVKPDVVFLDLRMPKFDGFYALEQIKKSDPDALVILISADSVDSIERDLKEHKPFAIIPKPFSIDILNQTILSITTNNKNLISIAIKKTLNGIDNKTLSLVQDKLSEDYHCNLSDCLENPEYLNRILKDIYGKSYCTIVNSIQETLDELSEDSIISEFLLELSK